MRRGALDTLDPPRRRRDRQSRSRQYREMTGMHGRRRDYTLALLIRSTLALRATFADEHPGRLILTTPGDGRIERVVEPSNGTYPSSPLVANEERSSSSR